MERDWKTDPFDMASIDGYLYGRGTSDNKVSATRGCFDALLTII